MDPRTKALVQAALKQRQAAYADDDEQSDSEMPDTELVTNDQEPNGDERPSLREELNAEPLNGQGDEEVIVEEPDGDEELARQLSQNGRGGDLLRRVLESLSKKTKG